MSQASSSQPEEDEFFDAIEGRDSFEKSRDLFESAHEDFQSVESSHEKGIEIEPIVDTLQIIDNQNDQELQQNKLNVTVDVQKQTLENQNQESIQTQTQNENTVEKKDIPIENRKESGEESRNEQLESIKEKGLENKHHRIPSDIKSNSFEELGGIGPKTEDLDFSQIPVNDPFADFVKTDENGEFVLMLKNLDTGEFVSLKKVEEELKKHALDPVTLNILHRTFSEENNRKIDTESDDTAEESGGNKVIGLAKKKTKVWLKKFKQRTSKDESSQAGNDFEDDPNLKFIRVTLHQKPKKEFGRLYKVQELSQSGNEGGETGENSNNKEGHTGPVWSMKFSSDSKYLATAGQDGVLRIWLIASELLDDSKKTFDESTSRRKSGDRSSLPIFHPTPIHEFKGHTADILDISWSKNNFLISSSMDKTVRLWHITRKECLCVFQHNDFVTSVAFHPKDDRFFLTGSLDCKIRLWSIPEKRVVFWNEAPNNSLVTAVGFGSAGNVAIAGTYQGVCLFYQTQGLKYTTQIHVKSKSRTKGKKITGIENSPIDDQILISSNDSRLRLYHLNDRSLSCKYRGNTNMCSQIRASYRDDGKYVICGSEDHRVYIWNADIQNLDKEKDSNGFFSAFRRDRNESYESFAAHSNVVTCAIFAPTATKKMLEEKHIRPQVLAPDSSTEGDIIITADYTGIIRVFENDRVRPKSSGSLGKSSGLDALHDQEESGNDVHTHKRVGSTSSTNSLSSSGSNSNSLKINPFQKKDDKKDDKKEHICPSCGGTNTKTFGMVDEQKKKKKDEFKACLDCDITWKVS